MSPAFRYALLWIAGSLLILVASLSLLAGGFDHGVYIPSNADAFYHARRILDSVMTGAPVIQFDPLIHYPEGSWLTWPWGYDQLLAGIVRLFGPFASEAQANRVLMNIPVLAGPLAVALIVMIARQLALPIGLAAAFVVGFATLPIVYMLFAVSNIDHHYAEMLWALMTFVAGTAFFRGSTRPLVAPIGLGVVLGSAVAIHNGLWLLQIPVALCLALRWLHDEPLPAPRQMGAFALTLVAVTLLVCIPSEPWRRGFFEFYTLSWFHCYVAACVAAFSAWLSLWRRTRTRVVIVIGAALVAVVPLYAAVRLGSTFVTGQLEIIRGVTEAMSPYKLWWYFGPERSTRFLSWLMWLALPATLLNILWVVRWREPGRQFVALANVVMLVLLQLQYRFGPFGAMSLVLTVVLAVQALSEWRPVPGRWSSAACWLFLAVMFVPTWPNWSQAWPLGGSVPYQSIQSVFPLLQKLCDQRPGVVLGPINTGHWVRYHSHCPVIADVFLLTPQHAAKAIESWQLLDLSPRQLLERNRNVRYVFVHHSSYVHPGSPGRGETPDLDANRRYLMKLESELLDPKANPGPEYRLRWQVLTPGGQVYARLYEIERAS
jgi:hypothetical protein